jgi:hypothetical protein
MKKIFKKLAKKNVSELRHELGRAHLIVALLSVGVCALLTLGATTQVEFDPTLSAICVALLSFVTIISIGSSIALLRKKA